MMRSLRVLVGVLIVAVAACGDGRPSLGVFAEDLEDLVVTMNRSIDSLDAEVAADGLPTLAATRAYFEERLEARHEFLSGLEALEPPEDAEELYGIGLDVMTRLTEAEQALADRVDAMDTNIGLVSLWSTPEGRAVVAVDEEAVALCRAAEEDLDTTGDGSGFGELPWIPSGLQETVSVFFGCDADARRSGP
jgi:hypothetical protein